MNSFNYNKDTRLKYQDTEYAQQYHKEYFEKLSLKNFAPKIIAWRECSLIAKMLRSCSTEPKKILDIPCGTGKLASVLSKFSSASKVAADISTQMVAVARNFYAGVPGFRGFIRADLTSAPFEDNTFDCVICLRLFHRVPPELRKMMMTELARMSRSYVIISFGVSGTIQNMRLALKKSLFNNLTVPYPAESGEILQLAKDLNLRVERISSVLPLFSAEIIVTFSKII